MELNSQHRWFVLDMLVFAAINALALWYLHARGLMFAAGPLRLLLLGLATFRLADIIANESVTQALRAPFVNREQKDDKKVEVPKKRGFAGAMGRLLYCPSCIGVWVAMALAYGYILFPKVTWVIVVIFSLSALERFFTSAYNFLKKEIEVL